ncbi:MAG TPA: peroxide stress protein YaaA [Acidimicrobiaceae bacterium]|nr:peroxide stress protein YaaA [Acidimicrobiaceae bacterium]HAX04938.1 peroxide stress protein YaaA [Acidimicrobiaceae bacterium]
MLIVLSPAKRLDFESELLTHKHSVPAFIDDSSELVKELVKKSPADLGQLMNLSPALSDLNAERFQDWEEDFTTRNSRPALLAFQGDVYVGMDVARYTERDFTRAQKTIRILSGLHGVLRPLDLIQPYRLEMGTSLTTSRGQGLYEFWGNRISESLAVDLEGHRSRVLINLASKEYFSAVDESLLGARVVSPRFLDEKNGKFKIISLYAKQARGAMASWLVLNRIDSPNLISGFAELGYEYCPERSTPGEPTFIRSQLSRP